MDILSALADVEKSEFAIIERVDLDVGALDASGAAALIDHTLLKPDADQSAIEQLCAEAIQYGFISVCVNPTWLSLCRRMLVDSSVKKCAVIGFPLGAGTEVAKAFEAAEAIKLCADEIDMVMNVGLLKSKAYLDVYDDILGVVQEAHANNVLVKVILETALLTNDEKIAGCQIAKEAGADFVKTSTGFGGGGATVADIALMRKTVGPQLGVKASGGVRTAEDLRAMVAAGATRIGASAGVAIVQGFSDSAADGNGDAEDTQNGDSY